MDLETRKSTNLGNDSSNALVKEKLQWLEPIQRVQSIVESGIKTLSSIYKTSLLMKVELKYYQAFI